jgi:hypothetical protein
LRSHTRMEPSRLPLAINAPALLHSRAYVGYAWWPTRIILGALGSDFVLFCWHGCRLMSHMKISGKSEWLAIIRRFSGQQRKLLISPGWTKILLTFSFGSCHLDEEAREPPPVKLPPVF